MVDPDTLRHWDALVGRLNTFVGSRLTRADGDEVRREILLRIYENFETLTDPTQLGPWAFCIARDAVIERLRRRSSGRVGNVPKLREIKNHPDLSPLLTCVNPFVTQLPQPYREVLMLTGLRGLSQREAAHRLGISRSDMGAQVKRARRMLRAMFEECWLLSIDAAPRVAARKRRH